MDKKNYLWIAIGVIAVVIALLLVLKTTDKSYVVDTSGEGSVINTETTLNTEAALEVNEAPGMPSDIVMPLAAESVIKADSKTITPKTIIVKSGEKVFITLSAEDDATHTIGFIDDALSFITKDFTKAGGDQSITFPAPAVGTYTYYIDDKANTGKLIIE